MTSLLLTALLFLPLRQEMNLELLIPRAPEAIADTFRNGNFRQDVSRGERGLVVTITARDISMTVMNDRIETSAAALERMEAPVRDLYEALRRKSPYLQDFLRNVGIYLRQNIAYCEEDLPQDPISVLANRRGHCVGYSNLVQALLAGAGVSSRPIRGFYLREKGRELIPIAHRWLEILLPGRDGLFYDPQYQNFTSRYIVIDDGVPFERIEKFSGQVLSKSFRVADQ
jgi:hypothetical protein